MLLKEIMTPGIAEISPEASLQDAAEQMRSLDIGALPVCRSNRIVGIVTDRDIAIRGVAAGKDPNRTTVASAMSPGITWCYEDENVEKAADIMEEQRIRRLLVMDHNKKVVGIVSLGDIARHVGNRVLGGQVLERVSEPAESIDSSS